MNSENAFKQLGQKLMNGEIFKIFDTPLWPTDVFFVICAIFANSPEE